MPCDHKFRTYLDLTKIDFEPDTLIVGTFNPAWPATNTAEWFYGRTANNCFWDVLPRLYGEESLINATSAEWKQFCHDKKVALTDLISSIDDADAGNPEHAKMLGGFSDDALEYNFDDFNYVDIVRILQQHSTIKNVYFTRGVTEAFWRHLWNPVAHHCNLNKLHERKLLPPSAIASYQQEAYNNRHHDNQTLQPADYVLKRWREEWHF